MQTLLRCYLVKFGFDWTSHLSMVEFYYKCSINEATTHSLFEVMYGYHPSTLADRLFPLAVLQRMHLIDWHWLQIYEMLLTNSWSYLRKRWQLDQLWLLLFFNREILFIFRRKGYTPVHRNTNILEIRNWVLTYFYLRWVSTLINCCYLRDVDYTPCFIVMYCLMRLRQPLFDLIKQRLKQIRRNMQLILA